MRIRLLNPDRLVHGWVTIPEGDWELVTFEGKFYEKINDGVGNYMEVSGERLAELQRTSHYAVSAKPAPAPCVYPNHP